MKEQLKILELVSLLVDTIEDINAPVPYEEDLSFLDIARICNNDQRVITLLIEKGATTKEVNREKVDDMLLHMITLETSPQSISSSIDELIVKRNFTAIQAALATWGFKGVALPVIQKALLLACSHPTLVEAAEFLKAIQQQEFRPFFMPNKWIISIRQLVWIQLESSNHDSKLIKLMIWLRRQENSVDVSISTETSAKNTEEQWKELIVKALSLEINSPNSARERDLILVSAKRLLLNAEPNSSSLSAVLCLLPLIFKDLLYEEPSADALTKCSLLSLEINDFLKWAKIRGYTPEIYSQEIATSVLQSLISLYCMNPEMNQSPEASSLYELISWFAKHIQDREIFTEWKAVADFAREHDLLELAEHIEHTALLRLEEL